MSLAFLPITKSSPRAVRDESDYQNPNSDLHIRKSKGRDPHGDRRSERFWENCNYSNFSGFSTVRMARDDVTDQLVEMVSAVKHDDRNRPRTGGVLRKLIWNPPTVLMAEWRAIQDPVLRGEVAGEMFRLFDREVAQSMPGPRIIDAHPDRHRLHIEALILFFNPATNERFPWSKGLRMDGAGSTTLAEDPDGKSCYVGANSRIAAIMSEGLRKRLAAYRKTLSSAERVEYELRMKLQHVLLETTIARVSAVRRRRMKKERPSWLQALCDAWVKTPGSKRMDRKIQLYWEKGLVTAEGFPFLPDPVFGIGNFNRWAVRGSRQTDWGFVPKPERIAWLRIWLDWIQSQARLPWKKQVRGLRVVETLVRFDRERGTMELRREVFWEVAEAIDHGLLSSSYILEFGHDAPDRGDPSREPKIEM